MNASWSSDDLGRIGRAEELQLASRRPDGSLCPFVTSWVVRTGDNLYVRSAQGSGSPWFRQATAAGVGRIRAGGVERDVTFAEATPDAHYCIDDAYHVKYDRYGPAIVGAVVGAGAAPATIRLLPSRPAPPGRDHPWNSGRWDAPASRSAPSASAP